MLAAHQVVAYMPETSFFRRYVATGILVDLYASGGDAAVVRRLSEDEAFARSELDAVILVQRAVELGGLLDAAIYHQVIRAQYGSSVAWVGDKDPRLIEFLPLVASYFKDATVINIIRDPRDVLLSKKKAAWSSRGHVWKHIFANRVQLKLGHFWGPRLFGANYHEIVYEELIASPSEALSRLCDRIGLPYDEAMLDFGNAAKKLVSQSELSWKKETFGPILTENTGKWKAGLAQREIALTDLCCKEAFRLGGYQPDDRKKGLSWRGRLWVLVGAAVIFLADWPYRLYRDHQVKKACKRAE
jgi:hypothetical protein